MNILLDLTPNNDLPVDQRTDSKTHANKDNNIEIIKIILTTLFPPLTNLNVSIEKLVPEINIVNPPKTKIMAIIVTNKGLVTTSFFNI